MLRFLADENLNNVILRGLLRRSPQLDLVRVQDVGPYGAADNEVLAWAAAGGRVLVTHDLRTVPEAAYQRVRAGLPMPGVVAIRKTLGTAQVIEDLLLLAESASREDCSNLVLYFPI